MAPEEDLGRVLSSADVDLDDGAGLQHESWEDVGVLGDVDQHPAAHIHRRLPEVLDVDTLAVAVASLGRVIDEVDDRDPALGDGRRRWDRRGCRG